MMDELSTRVGRLEATVAGQTELLHEVRADVKDLLARSSFQSGAMWTAGKVALLVSGTVAIISQVVHVVWR